MANMDNIFFANKNYKDKIYNITNLRLLSYEIYKLFFLNFGLRIIGLLSFHFPFSIFYELEYNFFTFVKLYIYLLIFDLCYFILFKSNEGQFSNFEFFCALLEKPNPKRICPISISFCVIYLITKEIQNLMTKLSPSDVKEKYNVQPQFRDSDEEYYYQSKGLTKWTIYESSNLLFIIVISFIFLFQFILVKHKFNLWPKLGLGRIDNFKNVFWGAIRNIWIIGIPTFFIIYFVFFIFYYHTLFIANLCFNYTTFFIIEYNIFFISTKCLENFICAKINYISYEINTQDLLIQKEIDFSKEENFYIIHHLKHLSDIYKYAKNIKLNTNLLKAENIIALKKKIYFFIDSLNQKFSKFLSKKRFFPPNNSGMSMGDNMKLAMAQIVYFFNFSANQILEKETSFEIIKSLIEVIGNIIIYMADAKINNTSEEKYLAYNDHIYFFIHNLLEIDRMAFNLIQSKEISEQLRSDLYKLRGFINHYFDLIRNRQAKYHFIQFEANNINEMLYGNENNYNTN